jgi:hypothetical protein
MNVEILAGLPIFVEVKDVRVIIADVKMVIDAAGFGPRPINKTAQKFNQFGTLFWPRVQGSGESATWFHNFLGRPLHHFANVHAMWIFSLECELRGGAGFFEAPRFGRGGSLWSKGILRE